MTGAMCVVCGASLTMWFAKLGREVYRCGVCGHIQVPAGIALLDNGRSIYEAETSSVFESDGNDEYYLDDGNVAAARAKLTFVRSFVPSTGKLLDVGAGYGHFLAAAAADFDAYGLEPSPIAAEWSVARLGVRTSVGTIENFPKGLPEDFDIVTAWDVIEHLAEPRRALASCRDRVRDGGWLFLSTPDAGSLMAQLLRKHWYYQDPVQHIHLFSYDNLARLLAESGFRVIGMTHFGRQYRLNYVLNRLRYLHRNSRSAKVLDMLAHLPERLRQTHVTIKLWDVIGLATRRI